MSDTVPAPAFLLERAREFAASGAAPVPARIASTVMLLRDVQDGIARTGAASASASAVADGVEVFVMRRAATMAFAAGMYAFPGGGLDVRDETVIPGWAGPSPADWAERLRLDEAVARAVVCAAVREVFEETGVLLATLDEAGTDEAGTDEAGTDEAGTDRAAGSLEVVTDADRLALIAREVGFAELLAERKLTLRSDLLVAWSRWITPDFEPRRYDTYFFAACLPAGQRARHVGGEADDVLWAHPADLLDRPMLPPTQVTLRELAACGSVAGVIAAAGERDPATPVRLRLVGDQFLLEG